MTYSFIIDIWPTRSLGQWFVIKILNPLWLGRVHQGSTLVYFMLLWGKLLQKIAARRAACSVSLSHKKDAEVCAVNLFNWSYLCCCNAHWTSGPIQPLGNVWVWLILMLTSTIIYASGECQGLGHIVLAGLNKRWFPGLNLVVKQDDSKVVVLMQLLEDGQHCLTCLCTG